MEKLIGLESTDYEHPDDKKALDRLKNNVAFRKIMTEVIRQGVERIYRIQYTGSCLKVDQDDYPSIYKVLGDATTTLGLDTQKNLIPELYLQYDYTINAFTTGETKPILVLNSGTLDLLERDEQTYIIGHELGHILSHHVLYHMIVTSLASFIDLGSLINTAIQLPLFYWYRMSELTADRAGLLACQDLRACIRAMIKMAGLPESQYNRINVQAFIDQAHDFNTKNTGFLDESFKFVAIANSMHPWLVMRAAELLKWVESGDYDRVLKLRGAMICPHCDNEKAAGVPICPYCGQPS